MREDDNVEDLVFIGSEATGYYGGAESCIGVFVSEKQYDKHKELFQYVFESYSHGELDGKHSDVIGNLLAVGFNSTEGVTDFIVRDSVDYDFYNFTEYAEEDEISDDLFKHLKETYERVKDVASSVDKYVFVLTEEEHGEVSDFIDGLRKGGR